ncbi:MAG TPA: DUF4861 family protein, partial [Burkholderiales bacterium]|nr:DUF4861 family protein [Burkholderiales bacterium]
LGLGGLSAWEGGTAVPLAGAGAGGGFTVQRTVLASGPLRALVKIEYSSPLPGARGSGTVVLFSAFADNIFCRQDIHPGPGAGRRGVYGVSLQKLTAEDVSFDKSRGLLSAWGRGSEAAGEVGLAVLFDPSDLAGLDENGPARTVKLNIKPGRKLTVWTVAGWGRGIVTAAAPAAKNWARLAADLGLALRAPVEVRFAKR